MTKNILILTQPTDLHAYVVAGALARKGAQAILWHTSDYPTRARESVLYENGARSVRLHSPETTLATDDDIDTVWHRRPALEPRSRSPHHGERFRR